MTINKNTKFLIVGLGLLGGSYARGLTEKGYYVEAITKNKEALLSQMDLFKEHFDDLYNYLRDDDREGMKEMMRISTKRRKKFDN